MLFAILGVSVIGLLYIYGGFLYLLKLLVLVKRRLSGAQALFPDRILPPPGFQDWPPITVYFPAYNEEEEVQAKIRDILAQDYPRDRFELIVVSDGSTDRTVPLAEEEMARHPGVDLRLEALSVNRGKAAAVNRVCELARYDLLVETDAETRFGPDVLKKLAFSLTDRAVGVAGARILYGRSDTYIAKSIGLYRSMEDQLRAHEQMLGVMAKVDGPCVAYRKSLWSPISEFEDIDQIIVLEATKQGYRSVMVPDAVCYDSANASVRQELRARRRMTRKAVLSTNKRWRPGDIVRYPFFSFALYSHKFIRFLSPVFLLTFLACLFVLGLERGLLPLVLVLLAGAGLLVYLNDRVFGFTPLTVARERLLSLLVANLGFAYGLVDWLRGVKKGRYVPTRQTGGT